MTAAEEKAFHSDMDTLILEMGTREFEIGSPEPSEWAQRRRHWSFIEAMFRIAKESNPL
jgi:hypothetical protein